jgi:hypothetical protein
MAISNGDQTYDRRVVPPEGIDEPCACMTEAVAATMFILERCEAVAKWRVCLCPSPALEVKPGVVASFLAREAVSGLTCRT